MTTEPWLQGLLVMGDMRHHLSDSSKGGFTVENIVGSLCLSSVFGGIAIIAWIVAFERNATRDYEKTEIAEKNPTGKLLEDKQRIIREATRMACVALVVAVLSTAAVIVTLLALAF